MSHVDDALLDAIAMAESGNDPAAIGDVHLTNKAYGAYQMRLPAFQDVQRLYPEEFGPRRFEELEGDAVFQRHAARRYLEALETNYGIADLDRLISAYNAGPSARRGEIRNWDYVQKVKQHYKPVGNAVMGTFQ